MSRFPLAAPPRTSFGRILAAALLAALIAGPGGQVAAQTAAPAKPAQSRPARPSESIDQRIANLHAQLKITSAEEPQWQAVTQVMRENAAALEKLIAEKRANQPMTAIDDMQTYMEFAQAHVDGLKNLIPPFQTLYNSMPDAQKKLADQVFARTAR